MGEGEEGESGWDAKTTIRNRLFKRKGVDKTMVTKTREGTRKKED